MAVFLHGVADGTIGIGVGIALWSVGLHGYAVVLPLLLYVGCRHMLLFHVRSQP